MKKIKNLTKFFYELGALRKVLRAHQQNLLTHDPSDNIAAHSFRVAFIGYFLAKELQVDADKVLKMCMLHDIEETRSGDMNWVNKRYVKVYADEIREGQLEDLPHNKELLELSEEYEKRETKESKVAKDADLLDQILLLKEYARQGNEEAKSWLCKDDLSKNQQIKLMHFNFSKKLGKSAMDAVPHVWWEDVWTSTRR